MKRKLICALTAFAAANSAFAFGSSVSELREAGFTSSDAHTWERVSMEGAVERLGYGSASSLQLLDKLAEVESDLQIEYEKSYNILEALMHKQSIDYVRSTIADVTYGLEKGTGDNGNCSGGSLAGAASISVPARTANAALGVGGFGPVPPNSTIRLGMAVAFPASGGGTPVDVAGTLGTSLSGGISVAATGSASSDCRLYAVAVHYSFLNQCLRWADSAYAGAC